MPNDRAPDQEFRRSRFRLGLFGDTRSGKTVYLTALRWLAKHTDSLMNARSADNEVEGYLGEQLAALEAGQWPSGTIQRTEIRLLIDRNRGDALEVKTMDFRGGDFRQAFYSGNLAESAAFVRDLFGDCSAYVFLLDPGDIDQPQSLEDHKEANSRTGAVLTAMDILRRKSAKIHLFHPPVAIVFTKSDRHPEVAASPEGYARQHMLDTWKYLRRYAPKNHRFFAVSSTGPLAKPGNKPPTPLQPSGVLEPLLWCAEKHRERTRRIWLSVLVLMSLLLLAGYLSLYRLNAGEVASQRRQLVNADETERLEQYKTVKGWMGYTRFALTHPVNRIQLLQEIIAAAAKPVEQNLDSRKDGQKNLRSVDDWVQANHVVHQFTERYPNTGQAAAFDSFLLSQRQHLASIVVEHLKAAARDGNAEVFDQRLLEYKKVSTPNLDTQVEAASKKLDEVLGLGAVKVLWHRLLIEPDKIDAIREQCRKAEDSLAKRPHSEQQAEFVRLIREAYDDLNKQGRFRRMSFAVQGKQDGKVYWFVEVGNFRDASSWRAPAQQQSGAYRVDGPTFPVDLLQLDQQIHVKLARRNYLANGRGEFFSTVGQIAKEMSPAASDMQGIKPVPIDLDHNSGVLDIVFSDNSGVQHYIKTRKRIDELADKLFLQRAE